MPALPSKSIPVRVAVVGTEASELVATDQERNYVNQSLFECRQNNEHICKACDEFCTAAHKTEKRHLNERHTIPKVPSIVSQHALRRLNGYQVTMPRVTPSLKRENQSSLINEQRTRCSAEPDKGC